MKTDEYLYLFHKLNLRSWLSRKYETLYYIGFRCFMIMKIQLNKTILKLLLMFYSVDNKFNKKRMIRLGCNRK